MSSDRNRREPTRKKEYKVREMKKKKLEKIWKVKTKVVSVVVEAAMINVEI